MSLPSSNIGGLPTKGTLKKTDKRAVFDKDDNTTYGVTQETEEKYTSGLTTYAVGTYYADEVFVMKDNAIYELVNGLRPFVSSDFDAELLAGSWEKKIGDGSDEFNWDREITGTFTIGDVIGGQSLKGGLEKGLFPDLAPLASANIVNNPREKTGAATVNITVAWTATKKTNPITSITLDGEVIIPTGNTQTGSTVLNIPANADHDFTLVVSDGTNQSTSTVTQKFLSGLRIGSTTKNGTTEPILDEDINAITPELRADRFATRTGIDFGGNYALIEYPASYGDAVIIINGLPNSAWNRSEKTYVNSLGYSETVKILVSTTIQAGSTNLQIT